jgi:hypothetical protein
MYLNVDEYEGWPVSPPQTPIILLTGFLTLGGLCIPD